MALASWDITDTKRAECFFHYRETADAYRPVSAQNGSVSIKAEG